MASSNSYLISLPGNAAVDVEIAEYYDWIMIEVLSATASDPIYIATDGSTQIAIPAASSSVPANIDSVAGVAGELEVFKNRQPKSPWAYVGNGSGVRANTGATVQNQQNGTNPPPSGYGTVVSLNSAGAATILVSPQ